MKHKNKGIIPSNLSLNVTARFQSGRLLSVQLHPSKKRGIYWDVEGDDKGIFEEWLINYSSLKYNSLPSIPLDLSSVTPFTLEVLKILKSIPFGEVLTYREVAERIGKPLAARAIGQACGRNPLPLIIPCHRVISSGKGIGGFTGGVDIKTQLLDFEGF